MPHRLGARNEPSRCAAAKPANQATKTPASAAATLAQPKLADPDAGLWLGEYRIDLAHSPDLNEHRPRRGHYPAEGSDTIPSKHTHEACALVTALRDT